MSHQSPRFSDNNYFYLKSKEKGAPFRSLNNIIQFNMFLDLFVFTQSGFMLNLHSPSPPTEKGKNDAAEAAKCIGSLDFGAAAGCLASPGDVRTFRCISHRDCAMRSKVVYLGNASTEGFVVFISLGDHEGEKNPLPKGFKGISAEFSSKVDSFIGRGWTRTRIRGELTMACGADEAKKLRVPSKDKISARRTTLTTSPMFMFATNADMLAWATESSRLITTRAEFDEVDDLACVQHILL